MILTEINIGARGQLRFSISSGWSMASLNIGFGIGDMNIEFEGLGNGAFLNQLLTEVGPELVDLMWPEIEPIIAAEVEEVNYHSCFLWFL